MQQKLIFIDLATSVLNFYDIKIERNKKNYYVIVSTGKIGNKGTTSIVYKGNDYDVCKNEFWRRVNDKKTQKYKPYNDVLPKINEIFDLTPGEFVCDICNKQLEKRLYSKINNYLRNETEVDDDEGHPLNNKVACFDCQSKYNLYKGKKLD